jgi:hypothetical protein
LTATNEARYISITDTPVVGNRKFKLKETILMNSNMSYPTAPQSPTTINDIEQIVASGLEALRNAPLNESITAAFKFLIPIGFRPRVQLEEDGRKKRSTASASNWSPETGEIVIYFERADAGPTAASVPSPGGIHPQSGVTRGEFTSPEVAERLTSTDLQNAEPPQPTTLQIQQCCEALAEAEKAGKAFIALKWFRDNELMARGYTWANSLEYRQAVLAKAIEVGAVVTASIPNPKAPQHPTTTIKLNRESEYAQAVVPRYQPIRAKGGASASEIILRDRGRF